MLFFIFNTPANKVVTIGRPQMKMIDKRLRHKLKAI